MPENNILVVEYEPRYADRVRAALSGQPFQAEYAKDGEEAMRSLDAREPKLIVLSSVVPKISAPDLIRIIRGRAPLQKTPILLTVSGYTGSSPKQDAVRMGASDILPKPYTESDFLLKVQQLLGVGQLTSNEIFGDLLNDGTNAPAAKKPIKPTGDVDKMLEETLAGVMPRKKAKTSPGADFERKLQDTLSGLEKSARTTSGGTTRVPRVESAPNDDVMSSQPVVVPPPAAAPAPVSAPAPAPAPAVASAPIKEEEVPTDGTPFGQYVLLEKIATGGMAEVWKARMRGVEGFQKIVAIKKILPHLSDNDEFVEMFVDEAKLAAQLNHNNIIHIYDLGKIANSYYIAMEYVDGHDLKNILKRAQERDQPVSVDLALFIASKIAAALDYAHRKRDFESKDLSLVHRDVSPQNVLISQEGDIKLCDFGIAKAATKASHTQVGALKGKLQYMSPEQASGKQIDRRSDIFALGTVLFEMITGRKLFTGENEMSILEQVREARVTPPSQFNDEVTPAIDRIVLKTLEKDPATRYQTAGDLAKDIESVLYDFKPTPTSADLAIYMHRLWLAEPLAMPRLEEPDPFGVPERDANDLAVVAPPPKPAASTPRTTTSPGTTGTTSPGTTSPGTTGVAMPAWDAPAPAKKRSPIIPLSVAAALVAIVIGAYVFVRMRPIPNAAATGTHVEANAAPASTGRAQSVTTSTTSTATTDSFATTTTAAAPLAQTTAQQPSIDADLVNQEVQKRLAAERARLEQQTRATQNTQPLTASAAAPAIVNRPAPVQQQPVVQTPPPATQNTATQPAPVVPQPQPATQTVAAAPVQQTDTVQRVREGDLVPSGTDGLTPAHVVRRGVVPYPVMARAQRIEGTVICSVLVSETGQVLDVRILRGVDRGGLNDAAMQIMRRSQFSPPTKDGVRVKAWTTVPVDFKL